MALFFQVLGMIFVAELGDKSQFLMIAMTSKYKVREILIGSAAAICVLNLLAVGVGTLIGEFLPTTAISIIAGIAFLCFAYMAIGDDGEEEHSVASKAKYGAILTVFGTFFIAELGDKTQLTALTLAADSSSGGIDPIKLILVLVGATVALFAADAMALLIGYFLGKTIPSAVFAWISFAIFAVFGVLKLLSGFEAAFENTENMRLLSISATSVLSVAFVVMSFIKMKKLKKREEGKCYCRERDGDE